MATGELYAVRGIGQLADRYEAFNQKWNLYEKTIEFSKTALKYNDAAEIQTDLLELIDLIFKESKGHFRKEHLTKLESLRQLQIDQIKANDPNFIAGSVPKDSSGCFIATATLGSYDAPDVFRLREFRDTILVRTFNGRGFVRFYYKYGPAVAEVIEKSDVLKMVARYMLIKPVVFLVSLSQERSR